MARDDGFRIADVDSGYYDDEKVRRLWRALLDVPLMTEATTVHLTTVLASWREGRRVTAEEAAPLWLPVRAEVLAGLQTAGLLDRTGRVPVASWREWYEPALERKRARQEAGRKGGRAKAERSSSNATASDATAPLERRSTRPVRQDRTVPSSPSVPSGPSSPARRSGSQAAAARDGESFGELMAANGLQLPGKGGPA
jgi:hypothetical protein